MPGDLRQLLREEPRKGRSDLTLLLTDADAFAETVRGMAASWRERGVTKVAALDSLGFVFGGAVARELGVGLVLLRKEGKSAYTGRTQEYVDFSGETKTFTLSDDAVKADDVVLLVDDWTETGAGLRAATALIQASGTRVVGVAVLHADDEADLGGLEVSAVLDRTGAPE